VIVFSVEGSADYARLSENPDLHANTKRVGHDVVPMWGSVLTEIDLASGLWPFAHNDTGNGSFFNDLDMMPIGMGEFLENITAANGHPAVSRGEAQRVGRTYFTMWTILKSTLLLSTRIDLLAGEQPSHAARSFSHSARQTVSIWGRWRSRRLPHRDGDQ
jgi:hypothetical protein